MSDISNIFESNLPLIFEKIVEIRQSHDAIFISDSEKIDYQSLNKKSNQIARYMSTQGLKKNEVLWISGEKNLYTYSVMIACLKLGVVYSIYDPNSPIERLKKIFHQCKPSGALIGDNQEEILNLLSVNKVNIILKNNRENIDQNINNYSDQNLTITNNVPSSNGAYIMFTSGSTGIPKGALITNDNLIRFITWSREAFSVEKDDKISAVNPLYFDNSVFDFYSTIFNGATLLPIDDGIVKNPHVLISKIEELECTQFFSVPSLLIYMNTLKAFNDKKIPKLKKIIFGGEGFPKKKLKEIYDLYSKRINFFNVYGPTECTCICSSYKINDNDFEDELGLPPLGKIGTHFEYLLLNEKKNKIQNDAGELCLVGPCVGEGYYNDKIRTDESFVQNINLLSKFKKMYKTGDLVRFDEKSSNLFFVARKDNQIKHMGYRIELEELEAACNTISYINEAVAFHGNIKNVSTITISVSSNISVSEKNLKDDLKKIIPHYMIPSKVLISRILPKNANGKIDKVKIRNSFKFDLVHQL